MMPIRKLLNRIRWDPDFGRAKFTIGYLDRVENRIVLTDLRGVRFPEDTPNAFELVDEQGQQHRVPLHRVKEVYRNGQRIWRRTR